MKKIKTISILFTLLVLSFGCRSQSEEASINQERTIVALNTRIAALETEIIDQANTDFNQWDVISFLYTQMPYALGTITPVPPDVTILPTLYEAIEEDPTETPTPWLELEYPLITRTGIGGVDTVINAFLNEAIFTRISLVRFVTTPCTTSDGLGGPPKCQGDELENTSVKAFPVSYTEGFHIRPEEIEGLFDFSVKGLLAVYIVQPEAYQTEYWPAGEYGVVFSSEDGGTLHTVILLVEGGQIVRLDYDPVWPPFGETWGRGDAFVLPPRGE